MRPAKLDNTLVEKRVALQRLLVVISVIIYIILFIVLYPVYGAMVSALSGIPTMTTSYLYGKWYGLLGVAAYLVLNVVLFITAAQLSVQESIYHIFSIGSLMLIGMAFIFGHMGDITKELREKINTYERNANK